MVEIYLVYVLPRIILLISLFHTRYNFFPCFFHVVERNYSEPPDRAEPPIYNNAQRTSSDGYSLCKQWRPCVVFTDISFIKLSHSLNKNKGQPFKASRTKKNNANIGLLRQRIFLTFECCDVFTVRNIYNVVLTFRWNYLKYTFI